MLSRLERWIDEPDKWQVPSDFIGQRFYMFSYEDDAKEKQFYFARHINFHHITLMMEKKGEMTCFFGTMDKSVNHATKGISHSIQSRYLVP